MKHGVDVVMTEELAEKVVYPQYKNNKNFQFFTWFKNA